MPRRVHRREHMRELGRLGGTACRDRYGLEYMQTLARRGSQRAAELRTQGPRRVRRVTWLPADADAALIALARLSGMSVSALVRFVLCSYVDQLTRSGSRPSSRGG